MTLILQYSNGLARVGHASYKGLPGYQLLYPNKKANEGKRQGKNGMAKFNETEVIFYSGHGVQR